VSVDKWNNSYLYINFIRLQAFFEGCKFCLTGALIGHNFAVFLRAATYSYCVHNLYPATRHRRCPPLQQG